MRDVVRRPPYYKVYSPNYNRDWLKGWNITKSLTMAIKNESKTSKAKFLLVIGTEKIQLNEKYRQKMLKWNLTRPNRILKSFSVKNNITYLDLLPFFRNYKDKTGNGLHFKYDVHWNKIGHRVASRAIYDKILVSFLKNGG